jgi:hypothetical protein
MVVAQRGRAREGLLLLLLLLGVLHNSLAYSTGELQPEGVRGQPANGSNSGISHSATCGVHGEVANSSANAAPLVASTRRSCRI